ncbi:8-oxo-dGTP diphosphatase [Bacillaceae bacterium W0354]
MGRSEKVILTNMCMVYDGDNILVQDRQNKNWPGITFPGGHIEQGESFASSVIREVFEETGLTIKNPVLCGVKQFQTRDNERYIVFLYKTNQFSGELRSSEEGEVFWIKKDELNNYQLANDFEQMFKVFDSDELSEFFYDGDEVRLF